MAEKEKIEHLENKLDELSQERLKSIEHKLDDLDGKVSEIERDLAKYRGMVGGILLIGSALIAFFKISWQTFRDAIK